MSASVSEVATTPIHRAASTVVEASSSFGRGNAAVVTVYGPGKRRRVLIIDDEADVANDLRLELDRYGFECDVYTDPVEAVRNFQAGVYEIILCDVRMPRMNGFHVYRELMAKSRGKARIFLLSDFGIDEGDFGALFPEVKVQGFLNKPTEMGNLAREVYRLGPPSAHFHEVRR
jgi:CheY-like chemotaxis protein